MCRVSFAKIFRFTRRANHLYKFAPSHPTRGAYHDRQETRGGMRWTRQRLAYDGSQGGFFESVSDHKARGRETLLRTAKSCGPDAPTLASRLRKACRPNRARTSDIFRKRRWQTSPVTGESAKETVKTIACGNAGRFRCTRCYSCAFYRYKVHTRPRVQRAPGIPHALFGRRLLSNGSGASRREDAVVCRTTSTSLRGA